jgi:hypothetical protein
MLTGWKFRTPQRIIQSKRAQTDLTTWKLANMQTFWFFRQYFLQKINAQPYDHLSITNRNRSNTRRDVPQIGGDLMPVYLCTDE